MKNPALARREASALLVPMLAAAALAGCAAGIEEAASEQPDAVSSSARSGDSLDVTTFASGLEAPWSIAFHGETALVSERDSGRILELAVGGAKREVGTVEGVTPMGEGGLLGIAVREEHLYAYFTAGTRTASCDSL